jgi:hypothetical protein
MAMIALVRWPRRIVVAVAGLSGLAGCAGILGYQYTGTDCKLDRDCAPGDMCVEAQCVSPASCAAGDSSCRPSSSCAPDSVCVGDGGPDEAAPDATSPTSACDGASRDARIFDAYANDAPAEDADGAEVIPPDNTCVGGDGATADFVNDPANCGQCRHSCSDSQLFCIEGGCQQAIPLGNLAPGAPPDAPQVQMGPSEIDLDSGAGELSGVLVHLPTGWIVGLGLIASFGGPEGYLGVYTSADGRPSKLVTSTPLFTVNGSLTLSNPQPTEEYMPATPIQEADYWLLGMWHENVVYVVATSFTDGYPECSQDCWYRDPINFGPLPETAPAQSELFPGELPSIYALVVTQ